MRDILIGLAICFFIFAIVSALANGSPSGYMEEYGPSSALDLTNYNKYYLHTRHKDTVFICKKRDYVENYVTLRSTLRFKGKYPKVYQETVEKYISSKDCSVREIDYLILYIHSRINAPSIKENGLWGHMLEFYTMLVFIDETKETLYIVVEDPYKKVK